MNHPSPKEDFQTAQAAFAKRDYSHAIFHLSHALGSNPDNKDYLTLLNRIINNAREPLSLIQPDAKGGMDYANAAVHAYIHAQMGKYEEAVALMAQILRAIPNLQYLSWISEWLSKPDRANRITPRTLMNLLFSLSSKLGDYISNPREREAIERILPMLEQVRKQNPHDGLFAGINSVFVRKLGQYDAAINLAKSAYAATPDYMTAVFLAGAYRSKGDITTTVENYQKALNHKPDDIGVRLDMGDLLCKDGQYESGLAYYKQALDIEPENAWAKPHFLYYQALSTKEPHWTDDLRAYTSANPNNSQAADLLHRLTTAPFVDYLLEPNEASISLLKQLADQNTTPTSLGLSCLEAPSAMLALQLYIREKNGGKIDVGVGDIQKPDPRYPFGEVDFALWKYDGTDPMPNVKTPNPQVAEAIAKIAARPYNLEAWLASARKLGAAATPARLDSLLGVMVHPPPRPPEVAIWDWINHVQVVAALSIAYIDTGWENSARRKALFSLARGPMDWTVGAAILALTQIGLEQPEITPELSELFADIMAHAPRQGGVPYMSWLVINSLRLPNLDPAARKELELIRNDMGY
jgi:tetratricopeptide (TPR) repeat protein